MTTIVPDYAPLITLLLALTAVIIAAAVTLIVGTIVHELAHITAACLLNATITDWELHPEHSPRRYLLGDITLELTTTTRRAKLVAIAPTIMGILFLLHLIALSSLQHPIAWAFAILFIAVVATPSGIDLQTLTA